MIAWLRGERIGWRGLFEVAPFIVLGLGMGVLTMLWERYHQGTQGRLFTMGLADRVLVAGRAVWFYLGKLFWPAKLTFSYPRWRLPVGWGWLVALGGLGGAAIFARRYIGRGAEVALAFYVATLGPVLGFVMLYTFRYTFVADHYQYLACIGPIALVSAGAEKLRARLPVLVPCLCAVLLCELGMLTWRQCGTYSDLETLWRTTITRNPESWMAHDNLGVDLFHQGRIEEALAHYREALRINPAADTAHYNLGNALLQQGRAADAIAEYAAALKINPAYAEACNNLGNGLFQQGRTAEALGWYARAAQLNPAYAEARNNLGNALFKEGRAQEAIEAYGEALRIDPGYANAHYNLGVVLGHEGRNAEAIAQFKEALDLQPDDPAIQYKLAWVLATAPERSLRDGARALQLATQASRSSGGRDPNILRALAAAYAQEGQFANAVETAQRALELAGGNAALAGELGREIKLYEAGRAFEEAR